MSKCELMFIPPPPPPIIILKTPRHYVIDSMERDPITKHIICRFKEIEETYRIVYDIIEKRPDEVVVSIEEIDDDLEDLYHSLKKGEYGDAVRGLI